MKKIIVSIISIVVIVLGVPACKDFSKYYYDRHNEWNTKVNNCILDENYRKDCRLILYKDAQNHYQQMQNKQSSQSFNGAMTGAIVGTMLKN